MLSVDRARLLNDRPHENGHGTRPALRNWCAPPFAGVRPGIWSRGCMSLSDPKASMRASGRLKTPSTKRAQAAGRVNRMPPRG